MIAGDSSKWALRPETYLNNADIEYKLKSRVFSVNTKKNEIVLNSGEHITYDKLLIATGSNVIKPDIPGVNANGVHFVRTNNDQKSIKEKAASAKQIVVVGGSFIGSEAASCIASKEKEVHLICGNDYPLEKVLGKEIGKMMLEEHKSNGVKVHQNAKAVSIQTCPEGNVRSITLSDGSVIEC